MRYTDINDRTVVTSFLDRWIPVHFVSTARPLLLLFPKGQAVFVPLSVVAVRCRQQCVAWSHFQPAGTCNRERETAHRKLKINVPFIYGLIGTI